MDLVRKLKGRSDGPDSNVLAWHDDGVDTLTDIARMRIAENSYDRGVSFGGFVRLLGKRTKLRDRRCG
jgi:hypothetical protein